jgi:D-3-phosphoglycerate dehydrogenase
MDRRKGIDCLLPMVAFSKTARILSKRKEFMQNFRVDNLENLLLTLKGERRTYRSLRYGKFHGFDPEGNKIELGEPSDRFANKIPFIKRTK